MTAPGITRRRVRIALATLALLALAGLAQAAWLWREAGEREAEAALAAAPVAAAASTATLTATAASSASAESSPRRRFATALALAAAGRHDEAQAIYGKLHGDTPLGQAARFNSANTLVRQAVELRAGPQAGQALPALELAKALYRDILRADPGHWPARYNLERAQRLLPEPEPPEEADPLAPRQRERAATTARGQSQGMP